MGKQVSEYDHRLVYMPLEEVEVASGVCYVVRDYWWLVHPEHGLCFWDSSAKSYSESTSTKPLAVLRRSVPLANKSRDVSVQLQKMWPFAEVRQIPLVIQPTSRV